MLFLEQQVKQCLLAHALHVLRAGARLDSGNSRQTSMPSNDSTSDTWSLYALFSFACGVGTL